MVFTERSSPKLNLKEHKTVQRRTKVKPLPIFNYMIEGYGFFLMTNLINKPHSLNSYANTS